MGLQSLLPQMAVLTVLRRGTVRQGLLPPFLCVELSSVRPLRASLRNKQTCISDRWRMENESYGAYAKCAFPLGIKRVRFRCGGQECCGLLQGMMLSVWGAGGSACRLETPMGTLDTGISAHSAPVPTSPHGGASTSTPGHGLRAGGPRGQGRGWHGLGAV